MDEIKQRINNLRRKMLVHSYLYYRLCTSIINDSVFDKWAKELVKLQSEYPEIVAECIYAKEFEVFDGTTGFDLPRDNWVENTANRLLQYKELNNL